MNNAKRVLIIVPTYNESMNVRELVPLVLAADKRIDILFIDDNSPDKTAAIVRKMMKTDKRLHLLERPGKMGLGTAYIAGFGWALDNGYGYVFEMDADLSHNPKYLPAMIAQLTGDADVVVGSRYVKGGGVVNWPAKRKWLSRLANIYASIFTWVRVRDLTAGFVGYRAEVLAAINFPTVRSNGYSFQIEMKFRCHRNGFRIREVPIIFADRERGESKISRNIIIEALHRCITLRFRYRPGK